MMIESLKSFMASVLALLSHPQRPFDCFLLVELLLSVHAGKCGRGKEGTSEDDLCESAFQCANRAILSSANFCTIYLQL